MLVAICSAKGAPGVTSTALALAASWPRPVVLLEADPAGGDIAYRCRAASGGPVYASPNLVTLAAAVRGGVPGPEVLRDSAQRLANGVDVVQGVTAPAQGRGLGSLWSAIAGACMASDVDVIADLGRLDRASAALPVAEAADCVIPVAATSLESVMRLREGVRELVGTLNAHRVAVVVPMIVGADTHAARDCAQLDELLTTAGLPVQPSQHLPYDPKALARLEAGEPASGRLGRTLLIRAARAIGDTLLQRTGGRVVSA
jgi:hypothetical protein